MPAERRLFRPGGPQPSKQSNQSISHRSKIDSGERFLSGDSDDDGSYASDDPDEEVEEEQSGDVTKETEEDDVDSELGLLIDETGNELASSHESYSDTAKGNKITKVEDTKGLEDDSKRDCWKTNENDVENDEGKAQIRSKQARLRRSSPIYISLDEEESGRPRNLASERNSAGRTDDPDIETDSDGDSSESLDQASLPAQTAAGRRVNQQTRTVGKKMDPVSSIAVAASETASGQSSNSKNAQTVKATAGIGTSSIVQSSAKRSLGSLSGASSTASVTSPLGDKKTAGSDRRKTGPALAAAGTQPKRSQQKESGEQFSDDDVIILGRETGRRTAFQASRLRKFGSDSEEEAAMPGRKAESSIPATDAAEPDEAEAGRQDDEAVEGKANRRLKHQLRQGRQRRQTKSGQDGAGQSVAKRESGPGDLRKPSGSKRFKSAQNISITLNSSFSSTSSSESDAGDATFTHPNSSTRSSRSSSGTNNSVQSKPRRKATNIKRPIILVSDDDNEDEDAEDGDVEAEEDGAFEAASGTIQEKKSTSLRGRQPLGRSEANKSSRDDDSSRKVQYSRGEKEAGEACAEEDEEETGSEELISRPRPSKRRKTAAKRYIID
ncbi:unnamed protein product [Protopolystoma xenopodis]|uniref:Uncharacterized protein n=1 Tax=Protopolystoma xenopodis TaxID=117903 RepID=A0A3S5FGC9_9PLAT|nr:unnamed protein product [Protopolystoma xenopodis]